MELNNIEELLLQEMENVKGGKGGTCYCQSGAAQGIGNDGTCVCSVSGAGQKSEIPEIDPPVCICDLRAAGQ